MSRMVAQEDIGDVVSNTGGRAQQQEGHSWGISIECACLEPMIVSLARFISTWCTWVGHSFVRETHDEYGVWISETHQRGAPPSCVYVLYGADVDGETHSGLEQSENVG